MAIVAASCGATASDGQTREDSGPPPLDAGLYPDATIEDCVSEEGVRLCGTKSHCYEAGPHCDCRPLPHIGKAGDGTVELGYCAGSVPDLWLCGSCFDGEVCVEIFYADAPFCASESLARLYVAHGAGDLAYYADYTPYTGDPLPEPTECPPPQGELALCGGKCGGCSGDRLCTGRSPTHPWGICADQGFFRCTQGSDTGCKTDEACLLLAAELPDPAGDPLKLFPSLCVPHADCAAYAAAIPGGATCE